jgi:ketosteroid isomerase-like protein
MRHAILAFILFLVAVAAPVASGQSHPDLARQVAAAESSFAATMAMRDHEAFGRFVADEAIFFTRRTPLRGKAEVTDWWAQYFKDAVAPFSWRPETVEVLPSGTLASSSGPVFDPAGKQTGTFSSIWRLEPDGRWRVIFDNGCQVCQ